MRPVYLYIFVAISSICTTFTILRMNEIEQNKIVYTQKINQLYRENTLLMNDFILTKLEDTYLDGNILLQDDKGKKVKLASVIGKDFTLVLRYNSFSCTPCVDSIVEKIRDFIKEQKELANVLIF